MSTETKPKDEISGLPEGIELDPKAIQVLLISQHKSPVGDDDPILMEVTLFNKFLLQYNKLLEFHNAKLTDYFSLESDKYLSIVKKSADDVKKGMSEESIKKISSILNIHKNCIIFLSIIITLAAIINVAVFVFRAIQ